MVFLKLERKVLAQCQMKSWIIAYLEFASSSFCICSQRAISVRTPENTADWQHQASFTHSSATAPYTAHKYCERAETMQSWLTWEAPDGQQPSGPKLQLSQLQAPPGENHSPAGHSCAGSPPHGDHAPGIAGAAPCVQWPQPPPGHHRVWQHMTEPRCR